MLKKLVVFALFSIALVGCSDTDTPKKQELTAEQQEAKRADQEKYNVLANKYYGKKIPYDEFDVIGQPETLTGTNNQYWVVYFPKGDFTLVSEKKTDIVKTVYTGRNPK